MTITKSLIFALALLSSAASYAFAASEVTVDRTVMDHQRKVAIYAASHKKAVPEIIEYRYGMELDIARTILLSPDPRACKVVPQLMTYENSRGELKTLKYQMLSDCRSKN